MKYPINLIALAAIFLFTACEKQIADEFQKNPKLTQQAYSNLLNPETMSVEIKEASLKERELLEAEELSIPEPSRECPYNDCDNFIKEYSARLQHLANDACETQFGAVVCCSMGEPVYLMLKVEPEARECRLTNDGDAKEMDRGGKVAETIFYQIGIKKDYCFLSGAMVSVINTIRHDAEEDFFNTKRFEIEWFMNDKKIAEGTSINECICGDEITVIVNDLVKKTSVKKTTSLSPCEITD